MVRFLHTADLQLGMPFEGFAGDASERLRQLRFESLTRLAEVAREREVEFVVVAGDFFDANTLEDRAVLQACERLRAFDVPVFVLPGNHDAAEPDSIYRRKSFRRGCPPGVRILDEPAAVPLLERRAVLLPAPLLRRHHAGDPTAHLTAAFGRTEAPDAIRIGIAHGSVRDFSGAEGQATNWIAPERAQLAALDYLALGDWHGFIEVGPRTFYSGTPEPTNFRGNRQGLALIVEIDAPGATPRVEHVSTARATWLRREAELFGERELEDLQRELHAIERPVDTLLRLELRGALALPLHERLDELLRETEGRLLHLRRRGEGVTALTDLSDLELPSDGYVGLAVEQLRVAAQGESAQATIARRALGLLHRLQHRGVS